MTVLRATPFPLCAIYKDRDPDPGQCFVISMDWEERRLVMSNGACRYFPSFDEVIFKAPHVYAPEPLDLIDYLREDEGSSVTIFNDNADFNGQPDRAIEVSGPFTDYQPVRYAGATLLECLLHAATARADHLEMERRRHAAG